MVVYAYDPSYSGDRDCEDCNSSQAGQKVSDSLSQSIIRHDGSCL
jgi:hypothetical protein